MLLQLQRSAEQESELAKLMQEQLDTTSPSYHQWLTPEEFGQLYGLSDQDIQTITDWLELEGFTVNAVYPSRMLIDFSGNAGQVRNAFTTEIHKLSVGGVEHIANMSDPTIPAALAPAIAGIFSLHDFMPGNYFHAAPVQPNYTVSGSVHQVVPADLATIYNLNPLFNAGYAGQGQTIGLIEGSNIYSTSDWTTFRSVFGLSSYSATLTTVHPSGSPVCNSPGVQSSNNFDLEVALDVEYASAAAPAANLQIISCGTTVTTPGFYRALANAINSGTSPNILSVSYGLCETANGASANAAIKSTYQQAAAQGISIFASSGDTGAVGAGSLGTTSCGASPTSGTGIGVSAYASTQYNVAVGGTDFGDTYQGTVSTYWNTTNQSTYGSARSYVPEIAWNDTCGSTLLASYYGFATTYGSSGYCNSASSPPYEIAGGGGPSGCATGAPSAGGTVSGTCAGTPKPTWQSGFVGNPNDGVRDIPDVALFAADGHAWGHAYVVCYSDPNNPYGHPCTGTPSTWTAGGGTSFSAPIMAGIQALVNQYKGSAQGNVAPTLYSLAANSTGWPGCNGSNGGPGSGCIFQDVTLGDIDVSCGGSAPNCYNPSGSVGVVAASTSPFKLAYPAAGGWDFATGLGSVNAYLLVTNWP